MVKRFANEIFSYLKSGELFNKLASEDDMEKRLDIIDRELIDLNITKCSLGELDIVMEPGTSHYLIYLIQEEGNIDMGLCPHYKTWWNSKGQQRRCRFKTGTVQMNCYGKLEKCSMKEEYMRFERESPTNLI